MFSKRANVLVQWLRDRAEEAGARGFVFGLSGGIDSAVVARLCQMATPNRVLGVILPCYSHAQDEADAYIMADAFGIPTAKVDLGDTFDALTGELESIGFGKMNVRARARTISLRRRACPSSSGRTARRSSGCSRSRTHQAGRRGTRTTPACRAPRAC